MPSMRHGDQSQDQSGKGGMMDLHFELNMECSLCRMTWGAIADDDAFEAVLSGSERYALCPQCKNNTVEWIDDPDWRDQCDRWIAEQGGD